MVGAVAVAMLIVVSCTSPSDPTAAPSGSARPDAASPSEGAATDPPIAAAPTELAEVTLPEPVAPGRVHDLADHAVAAFHGYLDGAAVFDGHRLTLTLPTVRSADRAALGALALGLTFDREGRTIAIVDRAGRLRRGITETTVAARRARLAATIEVAGDPDGRLLATRDVAAARRVVDLATALGVDTTEIRHPDGTREVRIVDPADRRVVARWPYVCATRVPGAIPTDCDPGAVAPTWRDGFEGPLRARWRIGDTGPLASTTRDLPPAPDGGVSWTNGEAQVYRPSQVQVRKGSLRLIAEPSPVVSVDTTPYVSGMVISEDRFGWGRLEIDAVIPRGSGLWPALWFLPAAACDAPGRCAGYESPGYVEVDIVETVGHEPGRLHTSLHWFDGSLRSATEIHRLAIDDGRRHTFAVDWRPGSITWSVDGVDVFSFATAVEAASPLAVAPDHRLVLNLAVGGSFAGEAMLGRTSAWWGESEAPPGFPDTGWRRATLVIDEVRFFAMR